MDIVNAPPLIPVIGFGGLLGSRRVDVKLSVSRYEDGALPIEQAVALLAVLVAENPAEVLEIGTFMGHTTRLMAENLPSAVIHTVDLPKEFDPVHKSDTHLIARRVVGREFKSQACATRIRQYLFDTARWDFKVDGRPTFFFIDGSHTYEYCRNDSEKCFALCGGRGVFLWDNCDNAYPGIVQFVQEWRELGRDIKRIFGTSIAYWKSV
jgi:hypothetical protein